MKFVRRAGEIRNPKQIRNSNLKARNTRPQRDPPFRFSCLEFPSDFDFRISDFPRDPRRPSIIRNTFGGDQYWLPLHVSHPATLEARHDQTPRLFVHLHFSFLPATVFHSVPGTLRFLRSSVTPFGVVNKHESLGNRRFCALGLLTSITPFRCAFFECSNFANSHFATG